jgi:hypothetical protein
LYFTPRVIEIYRSSGTRESCELVSQVYRTDAAAACCQSADIAKASKPVGLTSCLLHILTTSSTAAMESGQMFKSDPSGSVQICPYFSEPLVFSLCYICDSDRSVCWLELRHLQMRATKRRYTTARCSTELFAITTPAWPCVYQRWCNTSYWHSRP